MKAKLKSFRWQFWCGVVGFMGLIYLLTHLLALTKLPVFADEAIYIRWAQLIMDDPKRYLFFALNDGKTPLFIWSLVPFQTIFKNQLFAARFVSVLVGLFQMYLLGCLTFLLTRRKLAWFLGMGLVVFLPFWFFHHRMALMDASLTFWLSVSLLALVKFGQELKEKFKKRSYLSSLNSIGLVFSSFRLFFWWFMIGLALGLAILTKLPAVLYIPSLFVFSLYFVEFDLKKPKKVALLEIFTWVVWLGSAVVLALGMFWLLKFNPAFSQLFSRGGDFLFTPGELFKGDFKFVVKQWPIYLQALSYYLTPFVLVSPLIGLIFKRHRKLQFILFLTGVSFVLPIFLLGRVVYPRYFLPLAITTTIAYAILLLDLVDKSKLSQRLNQKIIYALVLAIMLANTISPSFAFLLPAWTETDKIPFVKKDQVQYLSSWSAGNGVKPVTDRLLAYASADNKIALATEGYFGTLPDGVLMYLHGKDVRYLTVEGIGQPVRQLPKKFLEKAAGYDKVWLLVNSNRLEFKLSKEHLIAEFCRLPDPYSQEKKCLQLWDVTFLVR